MFLRRPALTFFFFLYAYSVTRFLFTMLRVDSEVIAFGLRTPQLVGVITAIVALPFVLMALRRQPEADDEPTMPPNRIPVQRAGR